MSSSNSPSKSALLIVDMSVEQVENITYLKNQLISTINDLVVSDFFDLIIDTHLWIGVDDASSLRDLYPDEGQRDTEGACLIPELRLVLNDKTGAEKPTKCIFVSKFNYSSFAQPSCLDDILRSNGITHVYITGINTDYCVFATALDAFYARYAVFVVEDAVSSILGSSGHKQGLQLINKFACATVVSSKDILGENRCS